MKSLNHLICDNIIIVVSFRKTSIFVNSIDHAQLFRKNLISLSKICSKCSMRNSKKRICFKIKKTFFFENSSQINRELRSTSSLQSIKSRRLVKIQKAQNRKVWINTCLRNQFALFLIKVYSRNRSNYYTKCSMSFASTWSLLSRLFFSFSYFFVFFRFFFLLSHSLRSFQLQERIVLTSINKLFWSLIVSILNLSLRNEIEKKRKINRSNI